MCCDLSKQTRVQILMVIPKMKHMSMAGEHADPQTLWIWECKTECGAQSPEHLHQRSE